ncbi:addiction module protein [Nocardioides immobilis]|uniref:Addiction module protein n=1 Tax=Nocardioides immobilis TaxID=2049295 RepID=A0A417Y1A0_9ACTN|nr:addiction module protein [Nocardioides immobilis]RHW26375.1 addiction module protein [Nocardioides immobilis]
MAPDAAAIIKAGLALDLDDRAAVARALLASLPESAEDHTAIDSAWATEIARRVDDVLADRVELIDADEHYARLRSELAARPA